MDSSSSNEPGSKIMYNGEDEHKQIDPDSAHSDTNQCVNKEEDGKSDELANYNEARFDQESDEMIKFVQEHGMQFMAVTHSTINSVTFLYSDEEWKAYHVTFIIGDLCQTLIIKIQI